MTIASYDGQIPKRRDRVEQGWHRRAETFFVLAVGSALTWSGTILASPTAKVALWPPLVVCGLLAVVSIYMWTAPDQPRLWLPGREAAASEQRHTHPGYMAHVDDQHACAQKLLDSLYAVFRGGGRLDRNTTIVLQGSAGEDFRCHFPGAVETIDEWNATLARAESARTRLAELVEGQRQAIAPTSPPFFTQALTQLAEGQVSPNDLTWQGDQQSPSGGWILSATRGAGGPAFQAILDHGPPTAADIKSIKNSLAGVIDSGAAATWRQTKVELSGSRERVLDALTTVQRTHTLNGRCQRCP